MNPVTTALTLNMQLPNIATVSWAVQGDQLSRQITATLVDGSTAWNPQVGYHGVVRYHKPDGTSGVYDVDEDGNPAVTWTGNVATVKIVQQVLTVPGTVLMQLEFYDVNDARVTAFGWANNVQPSAVTDNEFLSSDYYNILTLQIAGVLGAGVHPPYIDATTKNWMIWDTDLQDYVDSGFSSVGLPPDLQSTSYEYANSSSGTVVPSTWSQTRPAPVQGQYSWTKVTDTWETGTSVYYTVAYQGIDGTSAADIKQMIAQEETSTTSAHAYAIGDYFILNDTLYVATAAIGIGDTITVGTNCQQATVGPELASLKTSLSSYVRPNLLDNWYFVGGGSQAGFGRFPINQRRQTSYTPGAGDITVDRWTHYNTSSVSLANENYIQITSSSAGFIFIQDLAGYKELAGKTVTATALFNGVSNGTAGVRLIISGTVYSPSADLSTGGLSTVTHSVPSDVTSISVNIRLSANTTAQLVAVKLEIGDTQTLAHFNGTNWVVNEVPDYTEELLKCQEYYIHAAIKSTAFAGVITSDGTGFRFFIPLPVMMRSKPTVNIPGAIGIFRYDAGFEIGPGKSTTFSIDTTNTELEPIGLRVVCTTSASIGTAFTSIIVEINDMTLSAE